MPTYISLLSFIDQGITTVEDTTQRSEGAAELAQEKYGCSLQTYWTVGAYDIAYIPRRPRPRERNRLLVGGGHQGSRQDNHASRLRSRRDVGDQPKARLRLQPPGPGLLAPSALFRALEAAPIGE